MYGKSDQFSNFRSISQSLFHKSIHSFTNCDLRNMGSKISMTNEGNTVDNQNRVTNNNMSITVECFNTEKKNVKEKGKFSRKNKNKKNREDREDKM